MRKLFFNLLSILTFLLPLSISANNLDDGTITGKVLDEQYVAVEGATITIKGTVRMVATNDNGEFTIPKITPGSYTLIISKTEFVTETQDVEVTAGKVSTIDIVLQEGTISIESFRTEVLKGVSGNEHLAAVQDLAIYAGKKTEVIQLEQVNANIPMNNTRQIFSRVPGISIWENDGTGVQMGAASRGTSPNRSIEFNTRMNGYEITPDPASYPEAYYMPPLEVVDRIEIVRGASSLQYGSGYGGLINFVLKKPDISTKFAFKSQNSVGSYGMFSTFNYMGGTIGKLNYTAFYQKRFGNTSRNNSKYDTDNFHAELGYAVSNKFKLNGEITVMNNKIQQTGGLTDAQFAADPTQSNRARNWFGTPWVVPALTAEYFISDDTKLSLKGFATFGERNSIGYINTIDVTDTTSARQIDRDFYKNYGAELKLQQNYQAFGKKSTLVVGTRAYFGATNRLQKGLGDTGSDFNLNVLADPKLALAEGQYATNLDYANDNLALFAENVFNVTDQFAATIGVRYEIQNTGVTGVLETTPKKDTDGKVIGNNTYQMNGVDAKRSFPLFGAGLEYFVTKQSNVYTNFTQVYRGVYFADLGVKDKIDENLKDSKGYNFDLGYRGKIGKWLNFDASYFILNYDNRIGTIDVLNGNVASKMRTNVGASQSSGVEAYVEADFLAAFGADKKAGSLSGFANVSFISAKYTSFSLTKVVMDTEGNKKVESIPYDGKRVENAPEYIHRFGLTYSNKNFSAAWQLSSVGDVYTDAINTELPNASATVGKIAGYSIQDFSASYKFLKHYNIRLSVNNLTDIKYATRRATGYPGPGLMPGEGRTFTVSGGVSF